MTKTVLLPFESADSSHHHLFITNLRSNPRADPHTFSTYPFIHKIYLPHHKAPEVLIFPSTHPSNRHVLGPERCVSWALIKKIR